MSRDGCVTLEFHLSGKKQALSRVAACAQRFSKK